jgi:hypothetical protein
MEELTRMANEAAFEVQYRIRAALWQSNEDFKSMAANDADRYTATRKELHKLAERLKCDGPKAPGFNDFIISLPHELQAATGGAHILNAWNMIPMVSTISSNNFSSCSNFYLG